MSDIADFCERRRYFGPTPCGYPLCDCGPRPRRRLELIWDGFLIGLAGPVMLITNLLKRFH